MYTLLRVGRCLQHQGAGAARGGRSFTTTPRAQTAALEAQLAELELRLRSLEALVTSQSPPMRCRQLGRTDMRVSALSLGCAGLGGVYGEVDMDAAKDIVLTSLRRGVNLFDTSPYYGATVSERVLGECLAYVHSTGEFKREDYYIATKVGRYDSGNDFCRPRIEASIDESLDRLQTDHIDLIQCHDMEFASSLDEVIFEGLPVLHEARKSGKVKYVGVTGLPLSVIDHVINQHDEVGPGRDDPANTIDAVLTYCCYTLNNTGLNEYLPRWKHRGIGVIQGGATSMGLLTPGGPQDWHPAPTKVREVCREAVELCDELGEDVVKLAFQYTFAQPDIATCLVGTISAEALETNMGWLNAPLDLDLVEQVQSVLAPIRNRIWVERGSEENIALATSGFWADGNTENVIEGTSKNLGDSK